MNKWESVKESVELKLHKIFYNNAKDQYSGSVMTSLTGIRYERMNCIYGIRRGLENEMRQK